MDCIVYGVADSRTRLSDFHTHSLALKGWNTHTLSRSPPIAKYVEMSSKNLCILIKFEFIQTKKLGDCSEHANLHSAKCCNLLRKAGLPNLSFSHSWLSPCRTLHCLENPTTTARLGSNNWLFRSFHGHKGQMHLSHQCRPWWDHQGPCHSLLSTHRTHWLQLYEVKMPKKKKMWRRCP